MTTLRNNATNNKLVLHRDALHGICGEITQRIEPESEADPVAILTQLLVASGNMLGRGSHFLVEGTPHFPNLFAVLIGDTARGRKGTSEGRVREILRQVDPDWAANNLTTGLVSGEGLIWNVRDPIYQTEAVKDDEGRVVDTQQVLSDLGIPDKRLLVFEPEYAATLRVCRREQNTLSPTLRSAWDSGDLCTMAKNSPAKATGAHISIVGHITQQELQRTLTEVEGFNGFANRFLWMQVRRSKLLPDGGSDLDFSSDAKRLSEAVKRARHGGRMHRDADAAALWRQAYSDLANDNATGLLAAVTSRAEAQVLRLSMVYALLDSATIITADHLKAALAVWQYCRQSAELIFGSDPPETPEAREQRELLETVRANGGEITGRELMRKRKRYKSAGDADAALQRLVTAGLGTWIEVPPGTRGGSPTRAFRLVTGGDGDTTLQSPGENEVLSPSPAAGCPVTFPDHSAPARASEALAT